MCGWSSDPKWKQIGEFFELIAKTDMEGSFHLIGTELLGWTSEQVVAYCAKARQEFRSKLWKPYYPQRVVCGRKP